jgi:hypothetical protein
VTLANLKASLQAPLPRGRRFSQLRAGIGVKTSPDLERILALPRRGDVDLSWVEGGLRRPEGQQSLRPAQALALYSAAEGGLAGPMRVGSGKTLVTLLLAELLGIERTVLLVPKSLVDKTRIEYAEYLKHWRVRMPKIVNYELLSRKNHARLLYERRPELIIADEAHRLKNPMAACTRRVERYVEDTGCRFVPLSGSMLGSVTKAHHLFRWALGDRSPLPHLPEVAAEWDSALDPTVPFGQRSDYGHLRKFGNDVPEAYRQWVVESPGVVAVSEQGCDASIIARRWRPELPQQLRDLILQVEVAKRRPTDGELLDPSEVAMSISQLAVGCCYRWYPLPPEYWLAARREWVLFVNDYLASPEAYEAHIDSPEQVAEAFPDRWAAWQEVRATFRPNTVVDWIDDAPLRAAVRWAKSGNTPGIVWSGWSAVGRKLCELGLPHHGARGFDTQGLHINDARGPVSASIKTCGTGCNLQHYRRNLFLTLPSDLEIYEQTMGRTHRDGQQADEVFFDFNASCDYHERTLRRALDAARRSPEGLKLALATWV